VGRVILAPHTTTMAEREPSTLDLTRYYLEHMSDIDLRDLEEMGRMLIPDLPLGFFDRPDP
jgi:hypothetical protein